MSQVNVNTPDDRGVPPETGSSGAGFIIGIVVAILIIAALVYFLVLAPAPAGDGTDGGADGNGDVLPSLPAPAPSAWVLHDLV